MGDLILSSLVHNPSPEDLSEIARQTLHSIGDTNELLDLLRDRTLALLDAVALFRFLVRQIDPQGFTEDDFVSVQETIGGVLAAVERHMTTSVRRDDATQCIYLGDSIRDLREARSWIAQGYSPDPAKRPTEEDMRAMTDACAAEAFAELSRTV
jgi:hypothetical protein